MRIPVLRTSVTFRQPARGRGRCRRADPGRPDGRAVGRQLARVARRPKRDGRSAETGLPVKWTPPSAKLPAGEGLAWRVPIGSRSTPVVFGNRIYLYAPAGDVAHRAGAPGRARRRHRQDGVGAALPGLPDATSPRTASPGPRPRSIRRPATSTPSAATPTCAASSPDGKQLWDRSLLEDYGAVTTHGGRTMSPVIDGDHVIVNTLISAWGTLGRGGNRYFAFDKKTGQTVWVSSPQARHWDTNYSTPIVADVDGVRLRHRRRHRRRVPRAQGRDRRAGLAARRQQARDQQLGGDGRQRRHRDAQRRELRHQRDGDDRRASTPR